MRVSESREILKRKTSNDSNSIERERERERERRICHKKKHTSLLYLIFRRERERERGMLSKSERKTVREQILDVLTGFGYSWNVKKRSGGLKRVYGKKAMTDWYLYDSDGQTVARSNVQLKSLMLRDAEILKACRDRKIMNFEAFMEESSSRRSWKNQPVKSEPVVYRTTRSGKKRTNTGTEKKRKRRKKCSSLARPRFGKKGLEHVDVRVLSDKKSQDAIGRLLMEAQSHLKSILEGLRGFAIHNDRERIRSLLSKYRTKQIVLIRPKVKSSANDYVKPDVELQGLSREALHHVVEKVKTRYEMDTQGFELETVSWVFVPPCAPPQSFHQDYEPSLIPSIRDVNVEMGTILHLQAESKSTSSLVSFT